MSQTSERIPCPHCGANNFPTSVSCWQCSKPLHSTASQPPPYNPDQPPTPPQGYHQQPSGYPPQPRASDTQNFIILGFIFAAVGMCFCPILLSPAAIVMGVLAHTRGNSLGIVVIVVGIISLVVGITLGVLFWMGFFEGYQSATMYSR